MFRVFSQIGYAVIELPSAQLTRGKRALDARFGSERVHFDRAARAAYTPNDPLWPNMWHARHIGADQVWDNWMGTPITVAVIDTGVDTAHPDLAANIWKNLGETPNNGLDDDGNGYVDDIVGYDFYNGDAVPNDAGGHGTACSGLVAAVMDNGLGAAGIAPKAKIMALRVANDDGYFYDSDNIAAYLYGADNGARIFSMSFFSDRVSEPERLALEYAWSKGVLPIVAAGNANTVLPYYPAAHEVVIAVAAMNQSLNKASFSNFGSWVDVVAPGTSLATSTPGGGYTTGFSGTSGACPVFAGAAALAWSRQPSLSNAQMRQILEDSAIPVSQAPFGQYVNYGSVDVPAAYSYAAAAAMPAAKPAVVRYVTPLYGYRSPQERLSPVSRIYGRGFQSPATVQVRVGGRPAPILGRDRDWIDVVLPHGRKPIEVLVNGALVSTVQPAQEARPTWVPSDASTQGATLVGGFRELATFDGSNLSCGARSDGTFSIQLPVRRVDPKASGEIVLTRQYSSTPGANEKVYVYDWSSASYPYGNWIQLSSIGVSSSGTMQTARIPVGPLAKYTDVDGTLYVLIQTTGATANSSVLIDRLNLVQ